MTATIEPTLTAPAVTCTTCGEHAPITGDASELGWAVQHSRETGHPDAYRVQEVELQPAEVCPHHGAHPGTVDCVECLHGDVTPEQAAYDQGYTHGKAAGLAARPPATSLVAVPITWRRATAGDTFRAPNGALWHVEAHAPTPDGRIRVRARRAAAAFDELVDPDEQIHVLHEVAEVDAITLAVEQLGARLVERRGGDPTG